jgi:hypothetical protein
MRLQLLIATVIAATALPRAAQAEESETGMRSPALFATGIVMGGAGSAGLIAGAYLFADGAGSCDGVSRDREPTAAQVSGCQVGVGKQVGGVVALVTGGALFLGGIPLVAVGASARDGSTSATVKAGPGGASLTVSF